MKNDVIPTVAPFECYLDKQPVKTAKDIAYEERRASYMSYDEIRRAKREYMLANPWA